MKNDEEEKEEKGIIGIQKCFRGYKARFHYHNLKEASITLQSCNSFFFLLFLIHFRLLFIAFC